MPKLSIQLEIERCKDCPFSKTGAGESQTSYARWCTKHERHPGDRRPQGHSGMFPGRLIASYIEYSSEEPHVPLWCPIMDPVLKAELTAQKTEENIKRIEAEVLVKQAAIEKLMAEQRELMDSLKTIQRRQSD